MKHFRNAAAQGDLRIERVEQIPADAQPVDPTDSHHIVAHSESGHHHLLAAEHVTLRRQVGENYISYLDVQAPTPLVHEKTGPTAHGPIMIDVGTYRLIRQREHTPQGYRRVAD